MPPAVEQLELGPIATNTYLVRSDGSATEAVVVDPSGDATEIRLRLAGLGARCVGTLLTHGHWDHLVGVADLAEGTGSPVYMAAGERSLLEEPHALVTPPVAIRPYVPDVLLEGGETLELAGMIFDVIAVPGHSPSHLAYSTDSCLFSGDVLFASGVGRTDLPGGDWETLVASIRTLLERLPGETVVYPGHGPATTLANELAGNPFLVELRAERAAAGD